MPLSLVKISARLIDVWRRYLNFLSGCYLWATLYIQNIEIMRLDIDKIEILYTIVLHYSSQNPSHIFRSTSSCLELQNYIKTSKKKHCPPNKSLRILFKNPDFITFYHFFNTFLIKKVITLVLKNTIFEISSQNWVYSYDFH